MAPVKEYFVFKNIKTAEGSVEEKAAAIKAVCEMPTHNGITKDEMLEVIRWLMDILFIVDVGEEHSNADFIRAMTDEDLAIFINGRTTCDCCVNDGKCVEAYNMSKCIVGVTAWLKQRHKEEKDAKEPT